MNQSEQQEKGAVGPSNSAIKAIQVEIEQESGEKQDSAEGESHTLGKSLMGRRRTGNNLYIKIPTNGDESGESAAEEENDEFSERTNEDKEAAARDLRRNSISMPVLNTMDLDALRQMHEKAVQDKMNSIDTASSVASSTRTIPEDIEGAGAIAVVSEKNEKTTMAKKTSVNGDSSDGEDERPSKQQMFRTKRRSSIAPLPALRLNDKDILANEMDSQSIVTQNSVTSINSLASLLKEKLQNVPAYIKKKRERSREFKVKAFVALLFLLIVFLISYAYIMYDYKVVSKMYFDRIKFSPQTRSLKIFKRDKSELLFRGHLGVHTHLSTKPVRCDTRDLNELCWEWGGRAKLFISESELDSSISCYNVRWQPLNENVRAQDCFRMDEGVHWYGGGMTRELNWPLDEGGHALSLVPFVTGWEGDRKNNNDYNYGSSPWGNVQRRYFINSNAVAIEIDDDVPLYLSINANRSRELCLKSRYDDFAFVNRLTKYPELAYRICTTEDGGSGQGSGGGGGGGSGGGNGNGPDMLTLHRRLTQQSLWDGLRDNEVNLLHNLIQEPVWQVTDPQPLSQLTTTAVQRYTDEIISMGFASLGHVLFGVTDWQRHVGDFAVDEQRFEGFASLVEVLQRRGFKVALTVNPLISTTSPMFTEAVERQLLITERKSDGTVPALTRCEGAASAGMLDITKDEAVVWWVGKLNRLVDQYKLNGFYLEVGSAATLPRYYHTRVPLHNPDEYKRMLMQKIDGLVNIIGVSGAVKVPEPPVFVSLAATDATWKGLRQTLASALSSSVLGYPFLLSNNVGGTVDTSTVLPAMDSWAKSTNETEAPLLPDEELYIRWLQLVSFMPSMKFSYLPSQFHSERVAEVAKTVFGIRNKHTIPVLKKYLSDAINDASQTLIRPLWMLDPQDSTALYVHDEFAVGPEIIVAPVLEQGQTHREVYLPHGVWKDGIDGSLRKGSRWIHNYPVPLEKVAHFIKMPDNTRF